MSIRLGDLAPNFMAESTSGPLRLYDWLDESWGLLLSHSTDFTPVCTTEISEMAQIYKEFEKRNVKVAFVSLNDLKTHQKWLEEVKEARHCTISFPIIADPQKHVSALYEMLHPNSDRNAPIRSAYLIGADKRIKMSLNYPTNTGRNFGEILRVIDSIKLTERHQVGTPANWNQGEECVILPNLSEKEIEKKFPKGYKLVEPYLKYTPQPESAKIKNKKLRKTP